MLHSFPITTTDNDISAPVKNKLLSTLASYNAERGIRSQLLSTLYIQEHRSHSITCQVSLPTIIIILQLRTHLLSYTVVQTRCKGLFITIMGFSRPTHALTDPFSLSGDLVLGPISLPNMEIHWHYLRLKSRFREQHMRGSNTHNTYSRRAEDAKSISSVYGSLFP